MVQNNKLFFILSICMGLIVIASNYLVQFPINKYGLEEILTYGAFSYPITFLITDMANRTYGKIKAENSYFRFYNWNFFNFFYFN